MKKISGSTTTVYVFSGSKIIVEYDNGAAPGSPSREYIYSGSTLLAKIDSTGRKYYHRDHLSNRVVTDSSGAVTTQVGHYPYGESWYNASNDKLIFTSYQRDSESGNDYAQARYYVSRIGRFSAVDPLSGNTGDPQSLFLCSERAHRVNRSIWAMYGWIYRNEAQTTARDYRGRHGNSPQ